MSLKKMNHMRAGHILVESRERALELLGEIESGSSFEQLAIKNSRCPSGAQGGDLGFFGPGQMVKEFESAVQGLKKGEVSGPVWTEFGHHIIKRIE